MSQDLGFNGFKLIDLENKFEKKVYIVENKDERKNRLHSEAANKILYSSVENIDKIKNCGSLYIKDFEVKYLRKEGMNKPKLCSFNALPENINPFKAEKFDLNQKRFIDLKMMENTEENIRKIFSLDTD